MAKKNYEKYQAEIHALREFVSAKGWSIADEREIVAKGGMNALAEVAKLHFRTTQMILQK